MCIFVNMTAVNLDAYQVLNEPGQPMPMTQTSFDALVLRFRKQFLAATNYSASLAAHRRPAEYREEQRREVADYLQVIQRRPEMQDIDVAKKSSGHVPTAVKTIWIANKELRSCFAALEIYCTQRDVPVHRIGVHLAEYKAYDRLFRLLGRAPQVNPASLVMLSAKKPGLVSHKSLIGFSSRYYEPFQVLRNMLDADGYLETHYNEDKQSSSFRYLYGSYQNNLEPVSLSRQITTRAIAYLRDNLFRPDEIKLLIQELLPVAQLFGERAINAMEGWADRALKYEHHTHAAALQESVSALKKARQFIYQDLQEYYSSLYTESTPKLLMKSKSQIQELVLDLFRYSNSKTGHIVMMRTVNLDVYQKLNPKEQENFSDSVNDLIKKEYLTYEASSPECLRLTEKGYDRIYDDDFKEEENQPVIKKKKLPTTDFADDLYHDVLTTLAAYGKDLETKPRVYSRQDEEGLRDHFLTMLASRYERTTVTGETFNKNGKTDILLKDDQGNNLFIAECKWWKGPVIFHSTIDQLFDNYVTWRDTKLALVFFVDNKDFSNVLNQIVDEAALHPYFVKFVSKKNDSEFRFIFRQKDDANHEVKLEILFFHFPVVDNT